MANIDPDLQNQALAALGYDYRVPTPGAPMVPLAGGLDPIAEQDAQLAAAQAQDAMMAGQSMGGPQVAYTPDPGMSPPPPVPPPAQALDPNAVSSGLGVPENSIMSEPAAMSYPTEGPAAPVAAPPGSYAAPHRSTGGGGLANPLPAMEKDSAARAKESEAGVKAAEAADAAATAGLQTSAGQLGETRSDTLGEVSKIQTRVAGTTPEYQRRLAEEQDTYVKSARKVEDANRADAEFLSTYEPKDRRSGTQRVMGAFAVGLSQMTDQNNLVAGLMQGQNVQTNNAAETASLIQRGIDRDLEQQRALADNKRTAMAGRTTLLGQMRERHGDEKDALLTSRSMMLDQSIQEIEALKTKGLSKEQLILANQTIDQLGQESARTKLERDEGRSVRYRNEERQLKVMRYQQQQANRPKVMTAEQILKLQKMGLENAKLGLENAKLQQQVDGGGAAYLGNNVAVKNPENMRRWSVAATPAEQEKMRAGVQGYAMLNTALGNIERLKTEYGRETWPDEAKYQMDEDRERVVAALNQMRDGSVIQAAEYERAIKQIPGAGDYTWTALPQIKAIRKSAKGQINARLGTVGAEYVDPAELTRPLE